MIVECDDKDIEFYKATRVREFEANDPELRAAQRCWAVLASDCSKSRWRANRVRPIRRRTRSRRARRSTAVCRLCAPSALVASLAGAGGSTCSAVPVLIKRVMAVVTGVMSSVSRSSIALILIDRVAVIYEITGGERGYGWNFRLILAPSADSPLPHMPPTPKHPSPGMRGGPPYALSGQR